MTMFEITDNSIPPGQYAADFEGIETITGQWGTRFQWRFKIAAGEFSGAVTSGFSGAERPSIKSNLARYLAMLEGDEPRAGLKRDPASYVGQRYAVLVVEGDSGSTKVASFRPHDTTVAATPAAEPAGETSATESSSIPF